MHKHNKVAVALGFNPEEDDAPKLLAKGKGYTADRIVELANQSKLPIYKDEALANQLQNLQLGEGIPTELYNIVAEILIFIAGIDGKYSSK